MISVNEKAMEIVNDMILRKEELKIEVSTLENGTTVIDLGQEVRGSWEAARMMAEILFGGIGQVSFETFPEMIDGVYYPAVNVSVDHAVLSLAGCDISGWELKTWKICSNCCRTRSDPGKKARRLDGEIQ